MILNLQLYDSGADPRTGSTENEFFNAIWIVHVRLYALWIDQRAADVCAFNGRRLTRDFAIGGPTLPR